MSITIGSSIHLPDTQNIEIDTFTIITLEDEIDALRVTAAHGPTPAIAGIRNGIHRRLLLVFNATGVSVSLTADAPNAEPQHRLANGAGMVAGGGALLWYDGDHSTWRILSAAYT